MTKATEISIQGSPYQRGLSYGRAAAGLIRLCVEHYMAYMREISGLSRERACETAMGFEKAIAGFRPEYLEEMRGIAEGSGARFQEIMALNARSELLSMQGFPPDECTAFALMPSATRDGNVLAGQNWDYYRMQRDCMVILRIHQENKPSILMFTEAGLIGGKGLNSCGVSLTLNALKAGYNLDGVPLHIKMRAALDSTNVSEAYTCAAQGLTACGGNLILCSGDGVALGLELSPFGVDGLLPENGVITHTNHYLSPRLQGFTDNNRPRGSTFVRLCRANELLKDRRGTDKDYLFRVLRDHGGYPSSICAHPDENLSPVSQICTNYSLVMDVTAKTAYFCAGSPCEGEFTEYRIEE